MAVAGAVLLWAYKMNPFIVPLPFYPRLLTASVVCMALSFFVAYFALRAQGVGRAKFFLAFSSFASGTIFYEFVYHYAFGISLNGFLQDVTQIKAAHIIGLNVFLPYPVWFALMLLPLLAYRRMHLNRYFIGVLIFGFACFGLWLILGFPKFYNPKLNPSTILIAYILNSATKVLVIAPALLFLPVGSSRPRTEIVEESEFRASCHFHIGVSRRHMRGLSFVECYMLRCRNKLVIL